MGEKMYGIVGYYDRILDGVADFMGKPHAFVIDGDVDAQAPRYRLRPLTGAELELFLEYWQIWRRWEDAFHCGDVCADASAVLPVDRARHDEIEPEVKRALAIPSGSGFIARAIFKPLECSGQPNGRWGNIEVVWTPE